jgi:hypothetical protein
MPVASSGDVSDCLVDDPATVGAGKTWVATCAHPYDCVSSVVALHNMTGNATNATGSNSSSNVGRLSSSAFNVTANCTGGVAVAYLLTNWSALADPAAANGIVGADSFEFVVQDAQGFNSTPATATLVLTTPLVASAATALTTAYEETATYLWLGGRDYSVENRPLWVEIVSVPSHGSLMDPATNLTLKVGDVLATGLAWPSVSQVAIIYTGEAGYFNQPSSVWDGSSLGTATDSFTFRVAAATDGSGLQSLAVTQSIAVVNVNDAPVLTGPTINGSSSFSLSATNYAYGFEGEAKYPQILMMAGLRLTPDSDGDVDFIKVQGRLALYQLKNIITLHSKANFK